MVLFFNFPVEHLHTFVKFFTKPSYKHFKTDKSLYKMTKIQEFHIFDHIKPLLCTFWSWESDVKIWILLHHIDLAKVHVNKVSGKKEFCLFLWFFPFLKEY